jgi:hypothetical protein
VDQCVADVSQITLIPGAFPQACSERSAMSIHRSETALPVVPSRPEPKHRRVPPRVRDAINELVYGRAKTITAAAEKVGLSRERLSRALSEPHIADYLRTRAARVVGLASGRAAARLAELIDAGSEHVSFDATRHVLAIAGIKPATDPQLNVNIELKAGYVIDLSEPGEPTAKIVGGVANVIDAKPVE